MPCGCGVSLAAITTPHAITTIGRRGRPEEMKQFANLPDVVVYDLGTLHWVAANRKKGPLLHTSLQNREK